MTMVSTSRSTVLVWVGLGTLVGCGLIPSDDLGPPEIPSDFPQLGSYDDARAVLSVDGTEIDVDGSLSYDDSGVDADRIRASMSLDHLRLRFRDVDEGGYTVSKGELTAQWSESVEFFADQDCGEGVLTVVGLDEDPSGYADRALWGTIQLSLCSGSGERMDIAGRFSATD